MKTTPSEPASGKLQRLVRSHAWHRDCVWNVITAWPLMLYDVADVDSDENDGNDTDLSSKLGLAIVERIHANAAKRNEPDN